jgi:hypothetical protein
MMRLKYRMYLSGYANCPTPDFSEVAMKAYRWVHALPHDNDFKPVWLIQKPPAQVLDETDKMCSGYGLSMYSDLNLSIASYRSILATKPLKFQEKFRRDKGDCVAEIDLIKTDGVAGDCNRQTGHFDFHEYENTDLSLRITKRINIFE